ncbi:MAG: hypothetical protein JWP97_3600 [Labilithrix sp.]|nr:hypothetical protein [Labilithrix sp.]
MLSPRLHGALVLGLLGTGCSVASSSGGSSGNGVDGADAAEATSQAATAVVVIERTTGPGEAARADSVIARFVRVRQGAVDEQALRIAGASLLEDLPAVGTCSTHAADDAPTLPRSVELLDVGALTVGDDPADPAHAGRPALAAPARTTVMLPRTMFDPTGGVSGVFYSGRASDAFTSSFTPSSRLQLRTTGGPDLPEGFVIAVDTPRDVSDVRVAWLSDPRLDVAWEGGEGDDAKDLVYVDVLSSSARLLARCTTTDTGHLVIAAGNAGASLNNVDEGQVAVHRVHRESFRTKGVDPGEIRFDVARVVSFRR